MSTQALLTAEQFAQLSPKESEDFELVEGELVPLSSPNADHTLIRDFLLVEFRLYLKKQPIGTVLSEIDCELSLKTVRRPHLSFFVNRPGQTIPRKQIPIPFAPDIAIEVLSPSESAIDVNRKVLDYQRAGCHEVWVVDKENGEIFIHTKGEVRMVSTSGTLASPLLTGFEVSVAEIFGQ